MRGPSTTLRRRLTGPLLVAGLAALVGAGPAEAQAGVRAVKWFLKDQQAGICVDFLVSPLMAAERVGTAGTPIPVEEVAERYPALARVARAETAYHGWIPAQYCWFAYATAVVTGRVVQVDRGRQPVVVGYLAIEARGLPGGSTSWMSEFFTNSGVLSGISDQAHLPVDRITFTRGAIPEEEEDTARLRYEMRVGRTTIQWDGGAGAPRESIAPRTIDLVGVHPEGGDRHVRATITADSVFAPSGSLRVVGSGNVAELMSASPIRLVAWFLKGTDADWEISH